MTTRPARPRGRRRAASPAAASHVDWLRLVEVSGPFLSLAVLLEAFPQGLDPVEPEVMVDLRERLAAWESARQSRRPDPGAHRAFVQGVLRETLEYPDELIAEGPALPDDLVARLPEHRLSLRPDLAIARPGERPALLVVIHDPGTALSKPIAEGSLTASPAERMRLLLRGTGVASGILTNGEEWMLVHAPPERTATFATWLAPLLVEEPVTLRALRSLLGARRVLGHAPPEALDGLLERSRDDEREVTDALGDQARRAVELLVSAIDSADREAGGRLLQGVEPPTLYEAVVTLCMRVIFLLAAEARGLLPDEGPWAESYALTPLRSELEQVAERWGEELLDRRADAWPRLLAAFRAVHGGVSHERVRLPGYGGGLFDPARHPVLEAGADGTPTRVSNRVVLRVLEHLQTLLVELPGRPPERRPLSYRALGVEQIGHVYERLLDHTAVRATAAALGLAGTKDKEPEVAVRELDDARAAGEDALLVRLRELTGRSAPALRTALARQPDLAETSAIRAACDNDDALTDRVLPFAGLLRRGAFGEPIVFRDGCVYVTESDRRRREGTHYTPPALTEPVVRYALEPLVYQGPAEGTPAEEWRLRRPAEILALKVCDPAMGSAAFLVAACRYLAARLVEAWAAHPDERPADAGADPEEQELVARRLVAERCLYGVDRNPLAVEIAKVSLWLATLRRDRPFTFLDHALRSGDSLLGITALGQLEALSLSPNGAGGLLGDAARQEVRRVTRRVREIREEIEASDAVDLPEVARKQAALARAEDQTRALKVVADLVTGASLAAAGRRDSDAAERLVDPHAPAIREALQEGRAPEARAGDLAAVALRAREHLMAGRAPMEPDPPRPFHWPLEFPEVFDAERPGFDAIVGNPPFRGGQHLSGSLTTAYREHLVRQIAAGRRGSADLCAYFFLRAAGLVARDGALALLATNTIGQGDTREVGLAQLVEDGATITRAVPSRPWPGLANLEVAQVWLWRGSWGGGRAIEERTVLEITSHLTAASRVTGEAHRLAANARQSFQGTTVLGMGFILTNDEASQLVVRDARNADVLMPYLGGEELLTRSDQAPERWAINFGAMSHNVASTYTGPFSVVLERVKAEREAIKGQSLRN